MLFRSVVNAGRLSVPCRLKDSTLNSADETGLDVPQQIGMVALDAPLTAPDGSPTWLMRRLGGGFTCLVTGDADLDDAAVPEGVELVRIGASGFADAEGKVAERYGSAVYLVRPDQHVTARWTAPDAADIAAAMARCTARVAA